MADLTRACCRGPTPASAAQPWLCCEARTGGGAARRVPGSRAVGAPAVAFSRCGAADSPRRWFSSQRLSALGGPFLGQSCSGSLSSVPWSGGGSTPHGASGPRSSDPGPPDPVGVSCLGIRGGVAVPPAPHCLLVERSEEQVVGKCVHDLVSDGGITPRNGIALLQITVARDGASESGGCSSLSLALRCTMCPLQRCGARSITSETRLTWRKRGPAT